MLPRVIVFLHPVLLPYHQGRLCALANECCNLGVSLFNVAFASYVDVYKELVLLETRNFENITLFPGKSLEELPKPLLWKVLVENITRLRPDVLFLYGYSDPILRRAKKWADFNSVGTVLISDTNWHDRKRHFLVELIKRFFVRKFDAGFVGGESSSAYLQTLGLAEDKIRCGYDTVDNDLFQQQSYMAKQSLLRIRCKWRLPINFFIFVGRLINQKNIFLLLDAYAAYFRDIVSEETPWGLVICGSGPEEFSLREYANRFGPEISKNIQFYGLVKNMDLIEFYSCASCMVLPSLSESWGLVINEAMACGLPVIVSEKCGCARDLAKSDVNGWTFDPTNRKELANLMKKMHSLESNDRIEMCSWSERIISAWSLKTFSRNALECAEIAFKARNLRK